MKKTIWSIIIITLIWVIIWYNWYNNKLEVSKNELVDLEDRLITEEDFIDDRANTKQWKTYKVEQEAMLEKQEWFVEEMDEMMNQPQAPAPIATWVFNKIDAFHFAQWWIEIIKEWEDVYIIFSEDFSIPKWPDLYVLLSNDALDIYSEEASLNIWALSNTDGKQIYKISSEEFDSYNGSVKIRCRAFDVMFSVAALQ